MTLETELQTRIEQMVGSDSAVLFMKGNRQAPQCGFSAKVVDILDELLTSYTTFDVLQDPALREGIKEFSDWPTIPQLYVGGQFVGGCDIISDMYAAGQLQTLLGASSTPVAPPQLHVTAAAQQALRDALQAQPADAPRTLRLSIGRNFEHQLAFEAARSDDVEVMVDDIVFVLDRPSARRAEGLHIDFVSNASAHGFKLDNPNAPPSVKPLTAPELRAMLENKQPIELIDVRTKQEWDQEHIDEAKLFNANVQAHIDSLPRNTPLVFICHSGARSGAAAQHYLSEKGFVHIYNVVGGMMAWAEQ